VIQGVTRGVQAETLEDVLLPIEWKMISVLGDNELRGKTEGGHASGKRAGGRGGHEGRLSSVVLAAELGPNEAPFDEAGLDVVELFGDFLADEFELLFVFFVAFGEEGFFNDFELVPAFETAVVFSFGLFCGFCGALLRCGCLFVGGGFGLFWVEAFEEELELSGVDLLAFNAVEDFDQSIDLLLQDANARGLFGDDFVFVSLCFDGQEDSKPAGVFSSRDEDYFE